MKNLLVNLLNNSTFILPSRNRCYSILHSCTINRGLQLTSNASAVITLQHLNQYHSMLSNNNNTFLNLVPRRFKMKDLQVAPNKYAKIKPEVPAGSLVSIDGNDSTLEELMDSEEGQISRKSKSVVQYPSLTSHFPYENDVSTLYYNGVHYHDLPVVFAVTRWNNLICMLYDKDHKNILSTSCGKEGYRNAKKKSPVANQQVGQNVARRALKLGVNCVKVVLRGVSMCYSFQMK